MKGSEVNVAEYATLLKKKLNKNQHGEEEGHFTREL